MALMISGFGADDQSALCPCSVVCFYLESTCYAAGSRCVPPKLVYPYRPLYSLRKANQGRDSPKMSIFENRSIYTGQGLNLAKKTGKNRGAECPMLLRNGECPALRLTHKLMRRDTRTTNAALSAPKNIPILRLRVDDTESVLLALRTQQSAIHLNHGHPLR